MTATDHLPLSVVLAFALPSYAFAVYYLARATQKHRWFGLGFMAIITYAYYLEATDIRTLHSYFYRKVLIMLGQAPDWVPLAVCCSWASLICIAMLTTNQLDMRWWHRPWLDGLIAVSIDMVSDPVMSASRNVAAIGDSCYGAGAAGEYGGLGIWVWCVPESTPQWLNVPIGNFVGWYLVVVVVSFMYRLVENLFEVQKWPWWKQTAAVAIATAISFGVLMMALHAYRAIVEAGVPEMMVATFLLGAGLGSLATRGKGAGPKPPIDWGLVSMPVLAWIGSISTLFMHGIDLPLISSLLLMVAAACISAFLVFLPYDLGPALRRARR